MITFGINRKIQSFLNDWYHVPYMTFKLNKYCMVFRPKHKEAQGFYPMVQYAAKSNFLGKYDFLIQATNLHLFGNKLNDLAPIDWLMQHILLFDKLANRAAISNTVAIHIVDGSEDDYNFAILGAKNFVNLEVVALKTIE